MRYDRIGAPTAGACQQIVTPPVVFVILGFCGADGGVPGVVVVVEAAVVVVVVGGTVVVVVGAAVVVVVDLVVVVVVAAVVVVVDGKVTDAPKAPGPLGVPRPVGPS